MAASYLTCQVFKQSHCGHPEEMSLCKLQPACVACRLWPIGHQLWHIILQLWHTGCQLWHTGHQPWHIGCRPWRPALHSCNADTEGSTPGTVRLLNPCLKACRGSNFVKIHISSLIKSLFHKIHSHVLLCYSAKGS